MSYYSSKKQVKKMSYPPSSDSEPLVSSGGSSLQDGVINYGTRAGQGNKSKGVG